MTKRMVLLLVVVLAVAVGLGWNPAWAQDKKPLKIGAPLPLTGSYAADGEHMKMGLELAVDDLNAAGGLLGRPVELVTYDVEDLLAETVAASAEYLIKKQDVDVVIEGYGGYGPDFLAYGGKYDVPFLHGSGSVRGAEMVAQDPAAYWNMFQVFSVEAEYGIRSYQGLTSFEKEYQYPNKKIALIHGDLEWDLNYTKAVADLAAKDGWEVVMDETVPYGTTDWGPILTKIREAKPAVISCSILSVADIASFVKQFTENPTSSLLDISYMVVFKEVQDAVGESLTGVMGYVTSYVRPGPENDQWKARFEKKFGMPVPLTTPPSTYDTVMVWVEAVKKVGDPRNFKAVCEAIKANPYKGLLGVYDFNNPQQTVRPGPDFPIAYSQYQGQGKLAFFGQDPFLLPPYMKPAWSKK
ncbi:MAG: ABC transporter substrate-binding protein [Thermodesulfobacteriota bacterium]